MNVAATIHSGLKPQTSVCAPQDITPERELKERDLKVAATTSRIQAGGLNVFPNPMSIALDRGVRAGKWSSRGQTPRTVGRENGGHGFSWRVAWRE
jgi:hypothetical protein